MHVCGVAINAVVIGSFLEVHMAHKMERIICAVLIVAIVGLGAVMAEKIYAFWSCGAPCYVFSAGIKFLKPPF